MPGWGSAVFLNGFSGYYSALSRGALSPGRDRATPVPEQVYDPSILVFLISPAANVSIPKGTPIGVCYLRWRVDSLYESNSHQIGTESIPVAEMGIVWSAPR